MTYGELIEIVENHTGPMELYNNYLGYVRVYKNDLLAMLGTTLASQDCGIDTARILGDHTKYLTIG